MRPLERAKDLWYSVAMFDRQVFTITLKLKLIMIMLGLSCALILILLFFYAHAEKTSARRTRNAGPRTYQGDPGRR